MVTVTWPPYGVLLRLVVIPSLYLAVPRHRSRWREWAPTSVWDTAPFLLWHGKGTVEPARIFMANLGIAPPFNYPIFLLRYHVFLHQESLTKVTTCLKIRPWSTAHPTFQSRCAMIKTVQNLIKKNVFFGWRWLSHHDSMIGKPSFSLLFSFFNPLVIQHSYGKSPYE